MGPAWHRSWRATYSWTKWPVRLGVSGLRTTPATAGRFYVPRLLKLRSISRHATKPIGDTEP